MVFIKHFGKYCPWCGRKNTKKAIYCHVCGRFIENKSTQPNPARKSKIGKRCEFCGKEMENDKTFCEFCGHSLGNFVSVCPHCKRDISSSSTLSFCPFCGKPLNRISRFRGRILPDLPIIIGSILLLTIYFIPYFSVGNFDITLFDIIENYPDTITNLNRELGLDAADYLPSYLICWPPVVFLGLSIFQSFLKLAGNTYLWKKQPLLWAQMGYIASILVFLISFWFKAGIEEISTNSINVTIVPFVQVVIAVSIFVFTVMYQKKMK